MKHIRHTLTALSLFVSIALVAGEAHAGPWGKSMPSAYGNHSIAVRGGFHGGHGGHGWGGHGHRGYGGGWVAPLLGAAIVGGAIYSTLPAPGVVQQPPVVVPQQPVITDPSRVSYYCPAYQQYYPQVTHCPTPWQMVPY
jgi:hypothetical protein